MILSISYIYIDCWSLSTFLVRISLPELYRLADYAAAPKERGPNTHVPDPLNWLPQVDEFRNWLSKEKESTIEEYLLCAENHRIE